MCVSLYNDGVLHGEKIQSDLGSYLILGSGLALWSVRISRNCRTVISPSTHREATNWPRFVGFYQQLPTVRPCRRQWNVSRQFLLKHSPPLHSTHLSRAKLYLTELSHWVSVTGWAEPVFIFSPTQNKWISGHDNRKLTFSTREVVCRQNV